MKNSWFQKVLNFWAHLTRSITSYTTDVTLSGTQGNAGATLSIKIPRYFTGSNLYYTSKTSGTDSGGGTITIQDPYP